MARKQIPPYGGPARDIAVSGIANQSIRQATKESHHPNTTQLDRQLVAPAWGWRAPASGRASYVEPAPEYQGTTVQVCGLFPFTAGSGSPSVGVPVGRHINWGEVVCLDPFAWLQAGLVVNTGIWVTGQAGVGKSSFCKRLIRGMAAFGVRPLILGDTKPDYVAVTTRLGGQVIRVGRGLDRINPLDSGPLGQALHKITGTRSDQLRAEIRGRRLSSLLALCSLVRKFSVANGEEVVLGAAVDLLAQRLPPGVDPTVPDVLNILREGPDRLVASAEADTREEYQKETKSLRHTLNLLCEGSLKGVFDGPTTHPLDLDAPAACVDISNVAAAGDTLVAAAMLSTWAYGFGMVDAAAALASEGLAPRRNYFAVMDELWRALRGGPGLVEHADALTRLNRSKGMGHVMLTHSLADLEALPTAEDRAKARGFPERCDIKVLAGLSPREIDDLSELIPMSKAEKRLVASWGSADSWQAGALHPGRGKYLIKTGQRVGIPVELEYVGDEAYLYDTDKFVRRTTLEQGSANSYKYELPQSNWASFHKEDGNTRQISRGSEVFFKGDEE